MQWPTLSLPSDLRKPFFQVQRVPGSITSHAEQCRQHACSRKELSATLTKHVRAIHTAFGVFGGTGAPERPLLPSGERRVACQAPAWIYVCRDFCFRALFPRPTPTLILLYLQKMVSLLTLACASGAMTARKDSHKVLNKVLCNLQRRFGNATCLGQMTTSFP